MQTMHHEQSGLPDTSYNEVPLLSEFMTPEAKKDKVDWHLGYIKSRFPKADLKKLGPIGISKKGTSAEQIIAEDRDTIQEQRQRLAEAEKQKREAEKFAAEIDKEKLEMENLQRETERTQARIDALQDEQGSNLESEAELRRLKQLKKNHQAEFERKKKEKAALEKQAKNKQKAEEKVSRERAKLDEIVKKRNLIEERLNSTKPLDDLTSEKPSCCSKMLNIRRSSTTQMRLHQKNKLQRQGWKKETKSSRGCRLRSRKWKRPCLCVRG